MTQETELRNIDLNLLLVFDVLYRTRSTTRAAEALLDEGFASLRLALQAGRPFDPATSTRTFRLYVGDAPPG